MSLEPPSRLAADVPEADFVPAAGGGSRAIEVLCDDRRWQRRLPAAATLVRRAAARARMAAGESRRIEVLLSNDRLLHDLNRGYRGIDRPTNVLSFEADDAADLGSLALSLDRLLSEAAAQRKRPSDHLVHLTLHGVLHLAGYDHERNADAARMEHLERRLLRGFGIADPYKRRRP